MTKGTCPKCRRESVTAETQNKNSSDRCPAAFLASLDVRIDVGGCLKLENVRLLDEREALLEALKAAADKLLWANSNLMHSWAQERPCDHEAAVEANEGETAARAAIAKAEAE